MGTGSRFPVVGCVFRPFFCVSVGMTYFVGTNVTLSVFVRVCVFCKGILFLAVFAGSRVPVIGCVAFPSIAKRMRMLAVGIGPYSILRHEKGRVRRLSLQSEINRSYFPGPQRR